MNERAGEFEQKEPERDDVGKQEEMLAPGAPETSPLVNDRDEAEVKRDIREAQGDKEKLEKLIQESEAIIKRGRGVSFVNRRDGEIILKHERRAALASALLHGEHPQELQNDEVKEEERVSLLEEVKKAEGLDALRELAHEQLGVWDAEASAKMALFASTDSRALGRYIATIEAQVYEMTKDAQADPLKLLEKKYQLAYAKDMLSKKDS